MDSIGCAYIHFITLPTKIRWSSGASRGSLGILGSNSRSYHWYALSIWHVYHDKHHLLLAQIQAFPWIQFDSDYEWLVQHIQDVNIPPHYITRLVTWYWFFEWIMQLAHILWICRWVSWAQWHWLLYQLQYKMLINTYLLMPMMHIHTFLCKFFEIFPLTVIWKITHIHATTFTTSCWRSRSMRSWSCCCCWWWWRPWTMVSWRGSPSMTRWRGSVSTRRVAVIVVIWVVVVMSTRAFQVHASVVWWKGCIARIRSVVWWTGRISGIRFSCVSVVVVSVRRRKGMVVAHINNCQLQPECRSSVYKALILMHWLLLSWLLVSLLLYWLSFRCALFHCRVPFL